MKSTLIVMSARSGELEQETRQTVERLRALGAGFLKEVGSTCVALARCKALSAACNVLRERHDIDMVLMLDDDMDVDSLTANAVVSHARTTQVPASAAYTTAEQKLAAMHWKDHPGLWLVGLGCLAIPRAALLELEASSESFAHMGHVYSAFTCAGAERGEWVAEDFRLCIRLGGVHLLPFGAGHVKKAVLLPDDETLAEIASARS